MYRITRVYAGNFGYRDAWFDGVTLEFSSPFGGEPTHTIIKAPNGTGKTSLLGFIFSCFEPQIKRFLPHLNDPSRHFHHYFDAHGLPAIALIEFLLPRHTGQDGKRLVIGQTCALHAGQPDRTFFSFEEADGLSLEQVPGPKLRGDGRVARTIDEFARWAQEMRNRHPGNFQAFESQAKWQEHLDRERGLDPYLFRVQLELSRREGAVDEGFLRFGSETDFLKMFFGMVLSEERGMKVREAVSVACQKLKDYPQYERRLASLQKLSTELVPFSREADALVTARESAARLTNNAAAMAISLDIVKERFDAARNQEERLAQAKVEESEQLSKRAEAAAATVEALEAERLDRDKKRAVEAESLARKARLDAEQAIQYVEAAQLLERIDEAKTKADRITRQISEEGQGLADFEREAREAGAILRYVLQLAEVEARDGATRHKKEATATTLEADRLDKENDGLQSEALDLERVRSRLNQVQEQFEQGLEELGREGLVNKPAGERAAGSIARHEQAAIAARADRARLEEEAQSRRSHAASLGLDLASTREKLGQLGEQKRAKDSLYNNGVAKRDELSELPVLCQAAGGADRIDPESASTALALEGFLARVTAEIARLNVRRAELESDERSLEATDLASVGADVEIVVDKLRGAGISSARPFPHYLAKVEPDALRARAIVLSNPARYLGVAVASEDDLANARQVLEQPPLLSRPVVVSLYSDQPESTVAGKLIVPAATDAAYNFEAADLFAKRLKEEINQLVENLGRLASLQSEGHRAKQSLVDFVGQYGSGKLASIQAETERLAGEIRAAEVQIESLNTQVSNSSKEAERLDGLARAKASESERLAAWLARLIDFEKRFESGEGDRKTEIARISRRLTAIGSLKEANVNASKAARSRVEASERRTREFTTEADRHSTAYADVSLTHDNVSRTAEAYANDPQTLTLYQDRYQQTKRTYDTAVEKRLGRLKADLEHAEDDLKRHRSDYKVRFPGDEDFLGEAKCLVGIDYRTERAERRTLLEERSNDHTQASNRRALAEEAESKHRNQRKHPKAIVANIAEIVDDVLSERIEAKRQVLKQSADEAAAAAKAADDANGRATTNSHCASQIETARKGLAGLLRGVELGQPDEVLLAKGIGLAEDVSSLVQALSDARSEATDAERRSRQAYDRVQKIVRSEAFAAALATLAAQLSRNSFEAACEDHVGLNEAITQQIAATASARDAVQADFDACLNELQGFSTEALDALRAATRKRLPDSVPHYGGKEVLLMKNITSTLTAELRRGMLKGYLENLIADNRIPQDGAHLAADAVVTLHGGQPLGLKLIRVTQHARLEYDDIAKIASSGGEKVTAAMLLYFVVVKLRAENRARRADGGPLILDNPFAKMNLESLWRTVRSLADSVGVQCIFATILEDKNALSVFDRLIELRPGPVNRRTDRRHVEAVDVTFKSTVVA